jgi:cobalt/nickel transport system ATP-binding protein
MALFELANVGFDYGGQRALGEVSLRIEAGERIGILGANGSGKSTLLRVLAGLAFAKSGEMKFEGERLREVSFESEKFAIAFRRRVQLLFQNADAQLFCPTVEEEVAFGPLQLGSKGTVRNSVDAALETAGIRHLRERSPHRLSGGEKKRVALAAILAIEPEVLLLDEPTAALDPRTQGEIVDFLSRISAERTVVTATHDLQVLPEIASRCLVFAEGKLVADGAVSQILEDEELLVRANLVYRRRKEEILD